MTWAPDIEATASTWVVELSQGCSPQQWAELNAWLAADVTHRAAFLRIHAAWRRCDRLRSLRPLNTLPKPPDPCGAPNSQNPGSLAHPPAQPRQAHGMEMGRGCNASLRRPPLDWNDTHRYRLRELLDARGWTPARAPSGRHRRRSQHRHLVASETDALAARDGTRSRRGPCQCRTSSATLDPARWTHDGAECRRAI